LWELVAGHGFKADVRPDDIEGFVVTVPDDLPETIQVAVRDGYEVLMADQLGPMESVDASEPRPQRWVIAKLADGSVRTIHYPATYAQRLAEHFTAVEILDLVSAIVQSAINPVQDPTCGTDSILRPDPEVDRFDAINGKP